MFRLPAAGRDSGFHASDSTIITAPKRAILKNHFADIKIKYLPKDKLMPDRGTLSVEKAKRIIGYEPQYPLSKGFVSYIEWYKAMQSVVI